jgi:hypothetical protein
VRFRNYINHYPSGKGLANNESCSFFVGENMKEKNTLNLCFKYNQSCKKCPRNNKCNKEIEREDEYGRETNLKTRKVRPESYKRNEPKRSV